MQVADTLAAVDAAVCASSAAPDAPLVIFVSKMVAMPRSILPRQPGDPVPAASSSGNDEVFVAFGRVYSGVAREGVRIHVLSGAAIQGAAPQAEAAARSSSPCSGSPAHAVVAHGRACLGACALWHAGMAPARAALGDSFAA